MARSAQALLERVRLSVPSAGRGSVELQLDGWPLVLVDLSRGAVQVKEVRAERVFVHTAQLPSHRTVGPLRAGAVVDELYLLIGDATIFVTPDEIRARHAHVQVIESRTGRLVLDRTVRCGPPSTRPTEATTRTNAAQE